MTMHELTLGALLLTGKDEPDADHGFELDVLAEGVSFGAAKGVKEVVRTLLADGDLTRTNRYGNREVAFDVEISGPTLGAVAQGEAALRRQVGKPNTLTWRPPSDLTPATVFEVIVSEMAQKFDDLDEMSCARVFTVTLECAPWVRPENLTVVEPLAAGNTPTSVSVDTCDVTTGWTGSRSGPGGPALAIWNGGVGVVDLDTVATSPETWTLTRAGSVDFTATPYLVIQARTVSPVEDYITVYPSASASGEPLPVLSMRLIETGGWYEITFMAEGVVPALTFSHTSGLREVWQGLIIRDIRRTNTPPGQSPRQSSRLIPVGGTERTPGSLRVSAADGTSGLALTLVSTWPDSGTGFSPPLRRWRVSGNSETTDAATFSGKREPLGTNYVIHDIPVDSLPEATYQLMGLLRASAAGEYRVESVIQSRHSGDTLGETTWGETVLLPANDWLLVPMGHYRVPIVSAKAGEFRVGIKTPSSTAVEYDEAWLFPMEEDCALTAVLTPEPHLWLDSPDLATRVPQVYEGTATDKSDAHWPRNGVYTMGNHIFTPGRTAVFAATHGVGWPTVALSYYKRSHSNVAEEG